MPRILKEVELYIRIVLGDIPSANCPPLQCVRWFMTVLNTSLLGDGNRTYLQRRLERRTEALAIFEFGCTPFCTRKSIGMYRLAYALTTTPAPQHSKRATVKWTPSSHDNSGSRKRRPQITQSWRWDKLASIRQDECDLKDIDNSSPWYASLNYRFWLFSSHAGPLKKTIWCYQWHRQARSVREWHWPSNLNYHYNYLPCTYHHLPAKKTAQNPEDFPPPPYA